MSVQPLTPAEERAARVLARTYQGLHHVTYWHKRRRCGNGIAVSVGPDLATFDWSVLTRLVIAAHDECVRVEIVPGGPRLLTLLLHPRIREGSSSDRHPTMEEAVAAMRAGS